MRTDANIVVIGGGIVGCSVLYHLSRYLGQDLLLVEKSNLTSGSTWHAAGNVTYFGHYPSITKLYVDSVKTYLRAEQETGIAVDFHETGSLRLATNQKELEAYNNLIPLYQQLNIEYRVIDRSEIESLHPFINTDGLLGAAYTPGDGHVNPSSATVAMAKAARDRGASIQQNCEITHIERHASGIWLLSTPDSQVIARHVVLANSFWAREMTMKVGLNLPLIALEHHELITDSIPELFNLGFELPTVRDSIAPANIRQEGKSLLCGVYELNPKPWALDGVPPDYNGELFPIDLDRLEVHLERVIGRIPIFGSAGIKSVVNGPICYTPDGLPLLGPVPDLPGLWLATGFCIGIGTGGGSGLYLSRWIVDGTPPYELPAVSPSRFSKSKPISKVLKSIISTYSKGYELPEI